MEDKPIATIVIDLLKKSVQRLYIGLIIMLILFIISVVDSLYQRHVITDIMRQYQRVEEVTESYDVDQSSDNDGSNNFITGDNNEVNR